MLRVRKGKIAFSKKNQIKDPNHPHLGSIVGPRGDESNQTIMRLTNISINLGTVQRFKFFLQNMIFRQNLYELTYYLSDRH